MSISNVELRRHNKKSINVKMIQGIKSKASEMGISLFPFWKKLLTIVSDDCVPPAPYPRNKPKWSRSHLGQHLLHDLYSYCWGKLLYDDNHQWKSYYMSWCSMKKHKGTSTFFNLLLMILLFKKLFITSPSKQFHPDTSKFFHTCPGKGAQLEASRIRPSQLML